MAEGLPTPKSREQILSDMLTEYVGLTGVNDLNTGSVLTQFFDVIARSVARTSGDIFQILRDYSVDRSTGEALNRIGEEERVLRKTPRTANGLVKVKDSSFEKVFTKIYAGAPSVNIGSYKIKVSDASKFPTSGTLYIGRGTPNIEGPLSYSSVAEVGSYWEITLTSPTTKFHNISETVILGQGGVRNVPAGTLVISPGSGATVDIKYTVSSTATLLDGENENPFVQVVAQEPGSSSNAPAGAIRQFSSVPFTGAEVINELPFTTGSDSESDDDYRDRIKKERLAKGLGTALAIKNAVLGAQSNDENAVVISDEIDTLNPEETVLYIDNGQGYEEKTDGTGVEFIVDSAIGGERSFQLATGGRQTSIAKAFLISSNTAPFNIRPLDRLAISVGGVVSEHIFGENDFKAPGAATSYEIVASINNNSDLTFEATTSEGGSKILIRSKLESNESLQISKPVTGNDAGPIFDFPSNEIKTILLYKNRELLNKDGKVAFVISKKQFGWSNTIISGETLIISVDGTLPITYVFSNEDFIKEGQYSIVSNQNSLSSWVNVINAKITGITAEINGEQIKISSNLGSSNRASIIIDPSSTLVQKGMFSQELGLSSQGNEADFDISRNTAQIKLKKPLSRGDILRAGSEFTRAEISSNKILGGAVSVPLDAYLWFLIDDKHAESVSVGLTKDSFISVSKPGAGIVRYSTTSVNAFSNVKIGDYVVVWSNELSVSNRLEARIHSFTPTTIDIKVTDAEATAAIAEGPFVFVEGFTVIRTQKTPQKIKVAAGFYENISLISDIMNSQLSNATVKIDNDEIFITRTNTEGPDGALFLVDFNDAAKSLSFIKNSKSISIESQFAFYESVSSDRDFPAFIHGKLVSQGYADPSNTFISNLGINKNLEELGLDKSGFLCLAQPYNSASDVLSRECVDIKDFNNNLVEVIDNVFLKRFRIDDRFYVSNGLDFGHEDLITVVLDNDPEKTFDIPLYRTAITNNTLTSNPDGFRAYDLEGGADVEDTEFSQFFGNSFSFNNFKCLMQAKNVIDPGNLIGDGSVVATDKEAILYRAVEWGKSGEKIGIGYFYPTTPDQPLSHFISVYDFVDIQIFLKSGAVRSVSTDGTTEWNVSIIPTVDYDFVTYTYSGTGAAPDFSSVAIGDYVSILATGEFDKRNTGSYKIVAKTSSSFTIQNKLGSSVVQNNVSNIQNDTIIFFESSPTTAQEVVDYVNNSLQNFITASILDDNGTDGSGIITDSTETMLNYLSKVVRLVDGKNYILDSNLVAEITPIPLPQFTFKTPLNLSTFSTNTAEAYSFNTQEKIKLIPTTSEQVSAFLNTLAVTGFTTLGTITSTNSNSKIQFLNSNIGESYSIQIAGGSANNSFAAIQGSASFIGDQSNPKCLVNVNASSASGFHSDQWVEISASEKQKKLTLINGLNSIQITNAFPETGYSKIKIFDKNTEQRIFGNNRFHTRTLNRTFRVEKQGMFTCISWDENGEEPYFLVNSVNINNTTSSTVTIFKNSTNNTVDINIDTGGIRFDEVALGDLLTISNRLFPENNGSFKIIGKSEDAKTIRILNDQARNELVSGSFLITDNTSIVDATFTVGSVVLTEGVDFFAGTDEEETASNLAAAISFIPNLFATSQLNTVSIVAKIPSITVPISCSSTGATPSGSFLQAPIVTENDLVIKSEIQEGDSVVILSDFDTLNRGIFRVVRKFNNSFYIHNPNTVEEEVTLLIKEIITQPNSSTNYNITKHNGYNRLEWGGLGAQPDFRLARPGDLLILGSDFLINNQGSFHITNSGPGFVDFVNVKGISESGVQITDTLKIHREAIKFKEYEGVVAGDSFAITNNFLGAQNNKRYTISEVLNENEIILIGTSLDTPKTLLANNFNKVYLEESSVYKSYKKINFVVSNPANLSNKNIVFDSANQFEKITELSGVYVTAMSKFNFPLTIKKGIDAYKYNIGLIAEANRIIYGDPRDNTTYPGVAAAGAEIFVKSPLIKRIEVSIDVRIKTGISFSIITEEVRNTVASLINSNPIGKPIAISDIVSTVNSIIGIQAVAISSPQYDAQNDVIRINSGEKSLVLDIVSDIIVSKIE
jgi:uncharacterized phage protein gp47/JayE